MADTTLTGGMTATEALSTSYLGSGSRYVIRGARRVTVNLDDYTVGFTVQITEKNPGGAGTATEEHVNAGGGFEHAMGLGEACYLDVKADSGTPDAQIRVNRS